MGENNEAVKIMDWVVGLLLFMIVIACLSILIVFAQQREEHFVQTMHEATDSGKTQRLTELAMLSDPMLCTAVASVLSEFGPEELAYVAISYNGTCDVYHYDQVPVAMNVSYIAHSSSAPIEEAVKKLLKHSDKECTVNVVVDSDSNFTHVEVYVR